MEQNFVETELSIDELEELSGAKWPAATCEYTWLMCLAAPYGCTDPCSLWYKNCT